MSDITLQVIDLNGDERTVTAATGDVLMHVLRDTISVEIGICGGEMACGTCMVQLPPDWLQAMPAADGDEAELLDVLGADGHARLGCQVVLDDRADGLTITLLHEE